MNALGSTLAQSRCLTHAGPVSLLVAIVTFVVGLALAGCSRSYPPPPKLPEPVSSASVGPGDVLEVVIVGEEKLPKDYEVQSDGTLDFPYLKSFPVSGLEPRAIATKLRDALVEAKYLVSPQVQVKVKAYNSKKIYILGQVARPGPLPFQEGLTLVQAITSAGGFTPLADTNHVQVIRQVHDGKSVNAIVSVDAITDNVREDVKLQQGDTIKIDQRLF